MAIAAVAILDVRTLAAGRFDSGIRLATDIDRVVIARSTRQPPGSTAFDRDGRDPAAGVTLVTPPSTWPIGGASGSADRRIPATVPSGIGRPDDARADRS
jgi:hypothetical protein